MRENKILKNSLSEVILHENNSMQNWRERKLQNTQSDQGVFAGTGALIHSQLQLHPICHPPCLVACETFDGPETSRVYHKEVLPTNSERSSMSLDIRDLLLAGISSV